MIAMVRCNLFTRIYLNCYNPEVQFSSYVHLKTSTANYAGPKGLFFVTPIHSFATPKEKICITLCLNAGNFFFQVACFSF